MDPNIPEYLWVYQHACQVKKQSLLHWAVEFEKKHIVEKLLKINSIVKKINKQDSKGKTALHYACQQNNTEIAKILIPLMSSGPGGAERAIDLQSNRQFTALHYACSNSNMEIIEMLLPVMSPEAINSQQSSGLTALHYVCQNKKINILKLLLPYMFYETINLQATNGNTALHYACYISNNLQMIELLLDHGADQCLDHQNDDGYTPAHIISSHNPFQLQKEYHKDIEIHTILLLFSKMTEQQFTILDNNDRSVLDFVWLWHNETILQFLLNNLSINLIGPAFQSGKIFFINLLHDFKSFEIFLKKLPNDLLSTKGWYGGTMLHFACFYNMIEYVKLLLQKMNHTQRNLTNNYGQIALDCTESKEIHSLFNPMVKSAYH